MVGFGGTGFGSSDSVPEINQSNIVAASVTSARANTLWLLFII
jgi:hypothetical protein